MCDNWKNDYSKQHKCEGVVLDAGQGEFVVRGKVETISNSATIMFWAANPPTYCTSYSGSGLPYPNADIAYENTPNRGAVKSNNGEFELTLDLFKKGGGLSESERLDIPLLGQIPISNDIVSATDNGEPLIRISPDHKASRVYNSIIDKMVSILDQ